MGETSYVQDADAQLKVKLCFAVISSQDTCMVWGEGKENT